MTKNRKTYFSLAVIVGIIIALAPVLYLSIPTAHATTLGIDTTCETFASQASGTLPLSLTTSSVTATQNELIIVLITGNSYYLNQGAGGNIRAAITDSSPHLTYINRGNNGGSATTPNLGILEWYALTGSFSGSFTITVGVSSDAARTLAYNVQVFGITGVNIASPFESTGWSYNGYNNVNTAAAPQVSGKTTSNANDMIIGMETDTGTVQTAGAGFTAPSSLSNYVNSVGSNVEYKTVSSTQSAQTYYFGTQEKQYAMIEDAVEQAPTPVTEQVTITPANSYTSSDSVTVSGTGASVSSIPMDGTLHTFTAYPSQSLTFTVPTDGTTHQYRFNNAGTAATTWSYTTRASGTDSKSNNVYYQLQNNFKYSVTSGAPTAPTLTGTQIGLAATMSLTTSNKAFYSDYGTSVTATNPTSGSTSSHRYSDNGQSYTITTEAGVYTFAYYNQYTITPYYTLSDSSSPTVTNVVSYNQFGSGTTTTPTLGTSGGTAVWVDSGSSVKYTSPITGTNQRWQVASGDTTTSTAIASVSSSMTATVKYYDQYTVTFQYTVSGGSTGATAPIAYYTQFNGVVSKTAATDTSVSDWVDATTSVQYTNPLGGSTSSEHWQTNLAITSGKSTITSSVSSSTSPINPTYFNQYSFQLDYAVSDSSTPTAPTLTATQFGLPYTPALTKSLVTYWLDNTQSWGVTNPLTGTNEQWLSSQTVTGTVSSSSPTTAGTGTLTFNYQNQYWQTVTSFPATGSGYITVDSVAQSTPYSAWWNSGSTHTIAASSTVTITSGQSRGLYSSWSDSGTQSHSVSPTSATAYTANFQLQYYFAVSSPQGGSPSGQNWYNDGISISSTVTTPISGGTGTQYVTTGWTGTGSLSSGGSVGSSNTGSFTIHAYTTCSWNWKAQYYLTVTSGHDTPTGAGWFDASSAPTIGLTDTTVSGGTGTQFVFTGWSSSDSGGYSGVDASHSVTMNGPITETANWQTQYDLTLATNFGSTSPTVGDNWENAGAQVTISATAPTAGSGEQYVWNDWTGSGTGTSYTGSNNPASNAVTMSGPVTETASWTLEYQIAVTQSDHGTISPDTTYVPQGDKQSFSVTPDGGYYIASITTDAGSINVDLPSGQTVSFPDVQADHTITATFAPSIQPTSITVSASPNPFDSNHPVTLTVSGCLTCDGNTLGGKTVTLSYNNDGIWHEFATVTTISDGTYSSTALPTSNLRAGPCFIKAEFTGDTNHDACTTTINGSDYSLNVLPEYIIGAGARSNSRMLRRIRSLQETRQQTPPQIPQLKNNTPNPQKMGQPPFIFKS